VKRGRSDDVRRGRVQPAGTPAIRLACLAAWEATSDDQILDDRLGALPQPSWSRLAGTTE